MSQTLNHSKLGDSKVKGGGTSAGGEDPRSL